ncbi:MAG: hypothetical protein M5U26_24535 [Planctomycetota bacterium]|nr:hypothetical protein [Planctomycetota bacterium]
MPQPTAGNPDAVAAPRRRGYHVRMREEIVVWAPARPPLKELEAALHAACGLAWTRRSAIISPLFHASPKYRTAEALPDRLRIVTLENGDYQLINNPGDPNLDEIFAQWPTIVLYHALRSAEQGAAERDAVLECHDLDTNWEKAGWTSGTSIEQHGPRKDRHKLVLGFTPWGWDGVQELQQALERGGAALAGLAKGSWEFLDRSGGAVRTIEAFFKGRQNTPAPDLAGYDDILLDDGTTFRGF